MAEKSAVEAEGAGVLSELRGDPPDVASGRTSRVRSWLPFVALCVYPLLVMGRGLAPGTRLHLRDRFTPADAVTDLDGAIRIGWLFHHMPWPWSTSYLSGFPDGESLVRLQSLSQGVQFVSLHVLSRVFEPVFAVNLIVTVGWITTGVAVYGLARRLGVPNGWAVAAGVAVQMLPAIATMASNFTSYVFIGVPIWIVSRSLDMGRAPSRRSLVWLCGALGFTILFDPYWFFFGVAASLVVLAVHAAPIAAWLRREQRWMQLLTLLLLLVPAAVVVVLLSVGSGGSPGSTSRPVAVETARFVDAGLRAPLDWMRSGQGGIGVTLFVLGVVGAVAVLVRRTSRAAVAVTAAGITMFLLATRTRVDLGVFSIGSLAEYVRYAMPGVRFFQRAALVAEALLVVAAVAVVRSLTIAAVRRFDRRVVAAGVALLSVVPLIELEPYRRAYTDRWEDFASIRAVLDEQPDPVLLALPFERHGRGWLEFGLLDDVAVVNQLYSSHREDLTALAASRGPAAFAGYLAALGTTHILAVSGDEAYPLSEPLGAPWFVERASIVLDGYDGPPETAVLYELVADPVPLVCDTSCEIGPDFGFLSDVLVLREVEASPATGVAEEAVVTSDGWAMRDDAVEVLLVTVALDTMVWRARMGFELTNPCPTTRTATVSWFGATRRVDLAPGERVRVVEEFDSTLADRPFTISTDAPACAGGPAGEDVTLAFTRPRILPPG